MQEIAPILSGIIIFGLLHGINPSHGWTIAVLYALQSKRPLLSSILSSGILAMAHFLSSLVVVLAFILFSTYIYIPQNYLNFAASIALGILAFMFWREKPDDLVKSQHGHLHQFSKEVKHDHNHWHKHEGFHRHLHTHQIRILPSLSISNFCFSIRICTWRRIYNTFLSGRRSKSIIVNDCLCSIGICCFNKCHNFIS